VYNNGKSVYQQANTNNFLHSDFNILQNNVSRSLASTSRQKLEISGSNQMLDPTPQSILAFARLCYLTFALC
jgi:hypothetical protein